MAIFCRADQRRRTSTKCGHPTAASRSRPSASPPTGVDDINAHISQVHDDPDRDKGLAFTYDQHIESGDCLVDARAERRELTELLKRLTPSPRRLVAARAVGLELHLGH
jgi:hypothetical protein